MRNPWVKLALSMIVTLAGASAAGTVGPPASAAPIQAAGGGGSCTTKGYPPAPVGVQISTSVLAAGATATATGEGFAPDVAVRLYLEPGSVLLAQVGPDAAGRFSATVTIPATTTPGTYEILATGGCPADASRAQQLAAGIGVTASAGATPGGGSGERPGGASGAAPEPDGGSSSGLLATTGTESLLTVVASLALILAGSAIVLVARRRRMAKGTNHLHGGRI